MTTLAITGHSISVMVCPGYTRGRGHTYYFPVCKAYHISRDKFSIATVNHGTNSRVKIWIAQRPPSHPQGRVSGSKAGCGQRVELPLSVPCAKGVYHFRLGGYVDCHRAVRKREIPKHRTGMLVVSEFARRTDLNSRPRSFASELHWHSQRSA